MDQPTEVKTVPELQKMTSTELRAHLDGAGKTSKASKTAPKSKAKSKPAPKSKAVKVKSKPGKARKAKPAPKSKAKSKPAQKARKSPKAVESRATISTEQIRAALKGGGKAATELAKLWKVTAPTVKRTLRRSKLTDGGKLGDLRGTVGRRPLIFTLK